jgi:phosphatidylglycerol lysyltransferase
MTDERERVLAMLKRHGWNATSFQVLEEGYRYWFDGEQACVAYVDTGRAWVAAGAPVSSTERLSEAAQAFISAATRAGRRACFFATESRFVERSGLRSLLLGEQPVWDPAAWPGTVESSRTLRSQLRRARSKGVVVRTATSAEILAGPLRAAIERLMKRWLASRPLAPMGFLVDLQPFSFPDERHYFVAEREGALVGFLAAVPVYTREGWLLEDLLRDPAAPNGTAELLVDAAMRALGDRGSRYVTLGLAPLAGPVTDALAWARDLMASLYDFRGVYAFRAKLRPNAWDPIYVTYPSWGTRPDSLGGTVAVLDALAAFARGRLAGFGIETLLRGPVLVVRGLALLLVPWTVLLALADRGWFPSSAVQVLWVAFDVVLAGGLLALAARWRPWLGSFLAAAVAIDALVTWVEIFLYNVPQAKSAWTWVVLAIAALAPSLAAVILGRAVRHRRGARNDPRVSSAARGRPS